MKILKITVGIYIIAMLLTACSVNGGVDSPTGQTTNLEGTSWKLSTFNKNRPTAGHEPTIRFEEGQVSGNAGCNSYGGSYQVEGEQISFGAIFMTEMWCEGDGLMDTESTYLSLLGQAESFQVADGVLTIFAGPQQTLTFESAE